MRRINALAIAALLGTLAFAPAPARTVAVPTPQAPSTVDLDRLTTETTSVVSTRQGSLRAEIHARPVRARTATGWAPVDTTLVRQPDGTVHPRLSTVELAFGGSGQRTIARLAATGGARLELTWPAALPAPRLRADEATYPELLPGVDLVVQATADGFGQTLVVKTPQAARQKALSSVRFGLGTKEMPLNLKGFMWDSSGSRRAAMPVETTASELIVTPDAAMLTDPSLVFPLYLDPWFAATRTHWTMVEQDLPTQGWWDAPVHARTGRDPAWSPTDTFRSFFQLDTAFLAGRHILSATFRVHETYSYSCTPEPLNLWRTDPISAGTNWQTSPALRTKLATVNTAKGFSASCPAGDVEFDVRQLMVDAATAGWASVTLGLIADEAAGKLGGKAFENNPSIAVEYNTVPDAPQATASDTMPGCAGPPSMWVTTLTPRLKVSVRDDDIAFGQQHRINFEIRQAGTGTVVDAPEATPPTVLEYQVPDGVLADGGRYEWRARATDEVESGPWGGWCPFTVDITGPQTRPGLTTKDFPKFPAIGLRVDEVGKFTFNALGDNDIVGFDYRISGPVIKSGRLVVAQGGAADLVFVPSKGGTFTITVAGVDLAGNKGIGTAAYQFRIRPLPAPAVSLPLNETSGMTAPDLSSYGVDGTVGLTGGVSWVDGRHGGGLHLDGAGGTGGYSGGAPVNTANSFSLMAWVRLRDTGEAWRTAVSIAGGGPELMYDMGRWSFVVPGGAAGDVIARADTVAQVGVWTHLAGVYDQALGTVSLYVNGRKASEAALTGPHAVAGSLVVGAADCCIGPIRRWIGDLDEVQVYDFAASQRKVQEEMGTLDLYGPEAWWQFSETSDVAALDSSGNGHTLARSGSSAWATGRIGGGLAMTGGEMIADRPILRTDAGYSVAAWVLLDRDDASFGAVSQDGTFDSGFFLGYTNFPAGWAFVAGNGDTADGSGPANAVAVPVTPKQLKVWTHLIGVYDHDLGQIRLYVNGRLAATAAHRSTRNAAGAFAVGHLQSNGWWTGRWPGGIDEVRAIQHALTAEEVTAWLSWDHYGPKALWDMDEGSGTVVDDGSENDHSVVTVGTTTWTTHTGKGNALHFDGSKANFTTGYPGSHAYTAGPVIRTDQSFTVAAWVRLSRDDTWYSAVSQDGETVSGFDLRYDSINRRWAFVLYGSDSASPVECAAGGATWGYQLGVWTHLAGVYDAAAGRIYLYVNGQQRASAACRMAWNAGRALQIGRSKYNTLPVNNWPGDIDKVYVNSAVLTAAQIAALM
ncbi:MAG TPA: LamG-like jellyroll fold domain-containing protein [Candidatus Limnocylindrales bacterium]|nr:LamG-like jellyroll fold domain-containing protein [Candidatus Limnocylindrales bacterium]